MTKPSFIFDDFCLAPRQPVVRMALIGCNKILVLAVSPPLGAGWWSLTRIAGSLNMGPTQTRLRTIGSPDGRSHQACGWRPPAVNVNLSGSFLCGRAFIDKSGHTVM